MQNPMSFTVSELKKRLTSMGFSISGMKAELINRFKDADPPGNWITDIEAEEEQDLIGAVGGIRSCNMTELKCEIDNLHREKMELMEQELRRVEREELLRVSPRIEVSTLETSRK